ncbi:hypothetical protein S40285_06213 [Stachybotrys chlorohalonatus IBT 40285]|uniref:Uncharacterized protein n=1 Tax=Stachybotrys chlorohalonatus (strain IBT 40285) TaxID=1283841 RepID=A0A084QCD7_STAC4|nr:hypothetical protein S40285_06213 [Stachybotrys chlorohalonata IBT 40285]
MAAYFHYNAHPAHPSPMVHGQAGGRNRRAPRLSVSQNSQRQMRGGRTLKELTETAQLSAFRNKFESVRSFDLEDDMEFCPNLLSDSDMMSISSASERSSLASGSPQSSPTQQPQTVASGFSLNSSSPPFIPPTFQSQQATMKLHQPSATRGRNAIPIINPATGISMSSPPQSVSPARLHQSMTRRW